MASIIILAGGKSSRMGRDKLLLDWGGETFLGSLTRRFSVKFDRVYVSLAQPDKYPEITLERIADIYPGHGPISGLHAALTRTGDDVFLVAADLPLATPEAAERVLSFASPEWDAVAPREANGRIEPLFAWYSRRCLPLVEEELMAGRRKMAALLERLRTRFLAPEELGDTWRDDLLTNVNRPEEYESLKNSHDARESLEIPGRW